MKQEAPQLKYILTDSTFWSKWTVLRSPHVDKKSREQFQLSSYKRLLDPEVKSGSLSILSPFLKDIIAVDDNTVKFIAKAPTVEFPLQIKTKHTELV